MSVHSAGILLYRFRKKRLEVLLAHPGGPLWVDKDDGGWSIPKGLKEGRESLLETAKREFSEETGFDVEGAFIELGCIQQPSKKQVHAWALEMDIDETQVVSNTFTMEWPRNSGTFQEYPEMDKAGWFNLDQARVKIFKGQRGFLDRLVEKLFQGRRPTGGSIER